MNACAQCGRPENPLRRHLCHACYERGRRAGRVSSLVDPTPTVWHISQLRFMGLGTRAIAQAAGVDRTVIQKITNSDPTRYINARSAAAILAIPIPDERVCLEWAGPNYERRLRLKERRRGFRMTIGGRRQFIRCGDCEHYPCRCPRADDAYVPLLGRREGGEPIAS